jgi:DNA-binding transcriptional MerR regulator
MTKDLSGTVSPHIGRFRHSEAWFHLLSSFDEAESDILYDIKAFLLTEKYSVKDTDITYRMVNTWCKAGIMADRREAEDGWRRLTFTDLIWLHLLIELRKFGLSIEQLALAYKSAFYVHGDTQKPWNIFAVGVAQCFQKTNISIVIFNDGFLALAFDDELALHAALSNQPYIKLNLNQLVRKVHPKLSHVEHQKLAIRLSAEELEVISATQEDDLNNITIRLKDGKIQRIEKERTQSNYQGSLNELIREMNFGEATLIVKEGRIAYVKQKEFKKI